jgi:hypothetical protein
MLMPALSKHVRNATPLRSTCSRSLRTPSIATSQVVDAAEVPSLVKHAGGRQNRTQPVRFNPDAPETDPESKAALGREAER